MIPAYVDSCRQKIADIRIECCYEFELLREPDFVRESQSRVATGAFGRAVSG